MNVIVYEMEVMKVLLMRIGHLVLNVVGVLRRAACCFRRRRRGSDMGLPITVSVKDSTNVAIKNSEFQSWDSWNESDAPISILVDGKNSVVNRSGAQRGERTSFSEEAKEDELFDDLLKEMTPSFTKTKKYMVKTPTNDDQRKYNTNSRMAVDPKASLLNASSELGTIEDNVETWEDELEDIVETWEDALKAQKQEERVKRLAEHQRRKVEKEHQRIGKQDNIPIATRLS